MSDITSDPDQNGDIELETNANRVGASVGIDEEADRDQSWCVETVSPQRRTETLERDNRKCQFCGRFGPSRGSCAILEVHHIERPPSECGLHELENLQTVCRGCHSWLHKRPTAADVPVELTESDQEFLLPYDYEILQILATEGPMLIGDIVESITPDQSSMAVRERLWILMGLDNIVSSRSEQLIDKDAQSREWGFPHQIAHSARGQIPEENKQLIKRVEDERVRRAIDRGCDRETIAQILGIVPRTTWHKERRARAFDIPLEAVEGQSASL